MNWLSSFFNVSAELQFAWPWLSLAALLPLAAYFLLPRAVNQHQAALRFAFANHLSSNSAGHTHRSGLYRWFVIFSWLLLVLAAMRPQWVGETVHVPVSGRSLMLAVDISGSMEKQDMVFNRQAVSRLTAVKILAGQFIDKRHGDYLGLILFGSRAYLQSPLSYDRNTVKTLLHESAVRLAGQETAIGDAIGLAVKRLRNQPKENRVLILLTDGANTAGNIEPLKAAELAANESIRIYTIGVGGESIRTGLFGMRLPNRDLDETTLKAIAETTGARFFRAKDIIQLQQIYAELDKIEPVTDEKQLYRPIDELYHWPLAASLLLLLIAISYSRYVNPIRIKGADDQQGNHQHG